MNYKKIKLITIVLSGFIYNTTNAQKLFATLGGGYGVATGASNLGGDVGNTTVSGNTVTFESVNIGLGKGLNFGASIGNMFTNNFGAELGIKYFKGEDVVINQNEGTFKSISKIGGNFININPSVIMQIPLKEINVYTKFGILISQGNIYIVNDQVGLNQSSSDKAKTTGGFGSGFTGAIGASYELTKKFSAFLEINTNNSNYAPKKSTTYVALQNGLDVLSQLDISEKETEFLDKFTLDNNTNQNPGVPSKVGAVYFSTGNTSINIGAKYQF
jgi:hypothetical protein